MSVSLRINGAASGVGQNASDSYLNRLMKMIPGEAVALYLLGSSVIPRDQTIALLIWFLFCLVGVGVIRALGTRAPGNNLPSDWVHVAISLIAFVIWV